MLNKKLNLLLILILILPVVYATVEDIRFYGTKTQILDIKETCFNNNTYCSATAICNISIYLPNENLLINNQLMSNSGAYHNYTLNETQTNELGVYRTTAVCFDNGLYGDDTFFFKITYNGKEDPSDFTKVAFIIGFITILCLYIFTLIWIIGHFINYDVDLMDVAKSFCLYFSIFALKYFNIYYFGNELISDFSDLFITIGGITHIFLPLIALILSITIGKIIRFKRRERERME